MIKVKITYCAECGYEPQTLSLAEHLMVKFGEDLTSIEIVPWAGGTFDVSVNGDLIHSMRREGGFPENATIEKAVRDRLAAAGG